jgi:hypothetical protein
VKVSGASNSIARELSGLCTSEQRETNPDWTLSWDASADHDWEARGGSVRVDTDASKIIDVPLAEVAALAEANTTHPFGEFTEHRVSATVFL